MKLTVINQSGRPVPAQFMKAWVQSIDRLAARELDARRYRGRELIIVFLKKNDARKLNLRFRRRNYATDVLSFESDDRAMLGELVICPEVISKRAREHGLLVREELGYMVLHGFLHLLGYDHERSKRDAKRMFDLQDRLFGRLLSRTRGR